MRKLVLFDIDGTLLRGYGAGWRSFQRAAVTVMGERCREVEVPVSGAIDPWILEQVAARAGYVLDDRLRAEFRRVYGEALLDEVAKAERRIAALPGVHELLAQLREQRIATLGLLTGNYAHTGTIKLRAVGIDPGWFEVAAWGDMARDRPGLIPVALAQLPHELPPEHVIVVGDTPRDVDCAMRNGACCVAVATGGSPRGELQAAGAHVVLDDLRDPAPLLALLS